MIENYQYKTKPFKHQETALKQSWASSTYALFMDMGTGKSKVLVDTIAMLYNQKAIDAVLIVAPKGVYKIWSDNEIPTHMPDTVEKTVVSWQPSHTIKFKEQYKNLYKKDNKLKVLIMNVEAFSSAKGLQFAKKYLTFFNGRALIGIDESTTIKSPTAKRTKSIIQLGKLAKYRRILTGSPITKSPLDLYTQCAFLDPKHLDQLSYYTFRNRYAVTVSRRFGARQVDLVTGFKNLDELTQKLQPFSYRVAKEECLDLPPKIYTTRSLQLTAEQRQCYTTMKEFALSEFKGKVMTAPSALAILLRLHQITCGHMKMEDGTIQHLPNNRLNTLMECLEETDGKVIIWANYLEDIKLITTALKKAYGEASTVEYWGEVDATLRQENIAQFQDVKGPTRFFVGNAQTGGYGITLTAANTVIYYSNNYDLEKRLQSEDRAHRIGQTGSVTYVDLVAEQTIDSVIIKALRKKVNVANKVLLEEDIKEWLEL